MVQVRKSEETDARRDQIRRTIREIEKLLPDVQKALAGSSLGQDALRRAQDALQRAREALGGNSLQELTSASEALDRTLAVFKGIMERAR